MSFHYLVRRPVQYDISPPMLILLHGVGSNEEDLFSLSPELDPRLMVVSLRAPFPLDWGGYSWFDIEFTETERLVDEEQAIEVRDLLVQFVEELKAEHEPSKTFIGGFSQGGMMSLGAGLLRPDLFDGVVVMSGKLLPRFIPALAHPDYANLPFLVQHGTLDAVLPAQDGREIQELLAQVGVPATYKEYAMGHEVSHLSLQDLKAWMSKLLA